MLTSYLHRPTLNVYPMHRRSSNDAAPVPWNDRTGRIGAQPSRINTSRPKLPADPSQWTDRDLTKHVRRHYEDPSAAQLVGLVDNFRLTPQALWYLQDERDELSLLTDENLSLQELVLDLASHIKPVVSPTTPRRRHARQLSEDIEIWLSPPPPPTPLPEELEPEDEDVAQSVISDWAMDEVQDKEAGYPAGSALPDDDLVAEDGLGDVQGLGLDPTGTQHIQPTQEPSPERVGEDEDLLHFDDEADGEGQDVPITEEHPTGTADPGEEETPAAGDGALDAQDVPVPVEDEVRPTGAADDIVANESVTTPGPDQTETTVAAAVEEVVPKIDAAPEADATPLLPTPDTPKDSEEAEHESLAEEGPQEQTSEGPLGTAPGEALLDPEVVPIPPSQDAGVEGQSAGDSNSEDVPKSSAQDPIEDLSAHPDSNDAYPTSQDRTLEGEGDTVATETGSQDPPVPAPAPEGDKPAPDSRKTGNEQKAESQGSAEPTNAASTDASTTESSKPPLSVAIPTASAQASSSTRTPGAANTPTSTSVSTPTARTSATTAGAAPQSAFGGPPANAWTMRKSASTSAATGASPAPPANRWGSGKPWARTPTTNLFSFGFGFGGGAQSSPSTDTRDEPVVQTKSQSESEERSEEKGVGPAESGQSVDVEGANGAETESPVPEDVTERVLEALQDGVVETPAAEGSQQSDSQLKPRDEEDPAKAERAEHSTEAGVSRTGTPSNPVSAAPAGGGGTSEGGDTGTQGDAGGAGAEGTNDDDGEQEQAQEDEDEDEVQVADAADDFLDIQVSKSRLRGKTKLIISGDAELTSGQPSPRDVDSSGFQSHTRSSTGVSGSNTPLSPGALGNEPEETTFMPALSVREARKQRKALEKAEKAAARAQEEAEKEAAKAQEEAKKPANAPPPSQAAKSKKAGNRRGR
ncbi:hypothetical protein C8Q79DRAFT_1007747 [Trametes meyenii]|nr:hypothetical protein C8Q79DRAFT_1007747 [Trametes meyenii]